MCNAQIVIFLFYKKSNRVIINEGMRKMGLFNEEVNENNWRECVNLKVVDNQRGYIEDNALSIVQSKYEPQWILEAIRGIE